MEFSDDARAILLLTAALKGQRQDDPKPLTPAEWRKLRLFLDENATRPQDLLKDVMILRNWTLKGGKRPMRYRRKKQGGELLSDIVEKLLKRDGEIHEKIIKPWKKACRSHKGIDFWILTYTSDEYPEQLKKRLPKKYPPLFFGVGDRSLLKCDGLAVVGSRHASDLDLDYAYDFGQAAESERITIISGGARGVDDEAMRGALAGGGKVVGILSDSPLERLVREDYLKFLAENKLVYMSVVGPQGHTNRYDFFRAAMERNAYIYCLSDAALVVHSSNKGGTWSGATENLEHDWVPLWVRSSGKKCSDDVKKRGKAVGKPRKLPQHRSIRTAVLLLTVSLEGDDLDLARPRPMNFREWGQFARWLWGNGLTPANLIDSSLDEILREWDHPTVSIARISTLLNESRRHRIARDEKVWDGAGIQALIKTDKMYPGVLNEKLGDYCPPVLFVQGDHKLLAQDKIAVIGSSLTGEEDERKNYAERLGTTMAKRTASVLVSTGGIGTVAADRVLSNRGKCIFVFAGELLKNSIEVRKRLTGEEGIALLSASAPHTAPTVQAFEYHSDIAFCLSDAGVVMHSEGQVDILQCATKCLQNNWAPLWIKGFGEESTGVDALVEEGGTRLSDKETEYDMICQLQNIVWQSTVIQRITEKGGRCLPQSEDVNDHIYHILDTVASIQEQVDQGPLFNQ